MDVRGQVIGILTEFQEGDEFLRQRDWSKAILKYRDATDALSRLPQSEPFDRLAFVASSLAGVALANVALGNHASALQCAENALEFFDQSGNLYPVERGKWLLAILAKGIASSILARRVDAEKCRLRAKQMLAESPEDLKFRAEVDQFVKTLDDLLRGDRVETKSWWQVWK